MDEFQRLLEGEANRRNQSEQNKGIDPEHGDLSIPWKDVMFSENSRRLVDPDHPNFMDMTAYGRVITQQDVVVREWLIGTPFSGTPILWKYANAMALLNMFRSVYTYPVNSYRAGHAGCWQVAPRSLHDPAWRPPLSLK